MAFQNLPFKNLLVSLTLCTALSAGLMSAPAKAQEAPTRNSAENDAQSLQQLLDRVRAGRR